MSVSLVNACLIFSLRCYFLSLTLAVLFTSVYALFGFCVSQQKGFIAMRAPAIHSNDVVDIF